jgi:hypothetical protein
MNRVRALEDASRGCAKLLSKLFSNEAFPRNDSLTAVINKQNSRRMSPLAGAARAERLVPALTRRPAHVRVHAALLLAYKAASEAKGVTPEERDETCMSLERLVGAHMRACVRVCVRALDIPAQSFCWRRAHSLRASTATCSTPRAHTKSWPT